MLFRVFVNAVLKGRAPSSNIHVGWIENTLGHRITIQKDLDTLESWAGATRMQFKDDKCNIMHLGKMNQITTRWMITDWAADLQGTIFGAW